MKGSPAKMGTIQGTAGHSSALKMRTEQNASALKQTPQEVLDKKAAEVAAAASKVKAKQKENEKMPKADWKKGQESAKSSGRDLDALVKSRKGMKKGSDEYNVVQNQINKALGSKKVHGATSSTTTKGKTSTTTSSKPGLSTKVKSNKTKKNVLTGNTTDVTKSRYEDDKGITTRKTKVKSDSGGDIKKTKKVIKTDFDKDGRVDKKTNLKTNVKKGTTKRVTKEGGRRTVTKTDAEGNKTTKSRRTLKGFLTGKGKKKDETPAKKALVGNQKNLPEHLKAKIDAAPAPGKMYGKSMAKKYDK